MPTPAHNLTAAIERAAGAPEEGTTDQRRRHEAGRRAPRLQRQRVGDGGGGRGGSDGGSNLAEVATLDRSFLINRSENNILVDRLLSLGSYNWQSTVLCTVAAV